MGAGGWAGGLSQGPEVRKALCISSIAYKASHLGHSVHENGEMEHHAKISRLSLINDSTDM